MKTATKWLKLKGSRRFTISDIEEIQRDAFKSGIVQSHVDMADLHRRLAAAHRREAK